MTNAMTTAVANDGIARVRPRAAPFPYPNSCYLPPPPQVAHEGTEG